ncbi:hypothetical protein M432DRAFT_71191 [Thermoascus aurantiacus ATCC 26904]
MPHKADPSDSSASSGDSSSGDRVAVHDAQDSSPARGTSNPKVVVHNGGGPRYDERRPSDWDKSRWK